MKFKATWSTIAAGVFLLTAGTLPASAGVGQSPVEPSPSALAADAAAPTTGLAGEQVLAAEGDGWSLYTDASSVGAIQVSQTRVAGSVTPMTVVDCGWVTCSVYLSRNQTQSVNTNIIAYGGGLAGLAASCGLISILTGPAAPFVAVACGVEISVLGGFLLNAVSRAAGDNGCLRIRYGALPTAFYDDHSSRCHTS